jgi:hypothetical protein
MDNFTFFLHVYVSLQDPHRHSQSVQRLGYGLDDQGMGQGNFLSFIASRPALGSTQLPVQSIPRDCFPGDKTAGA